jgi:hypothetical protein
MRIHQKGVYVSHEAAIVVFDTNSGQVVQRFELSTLGSIRSMAWSSTGEELAVVRNEPNEVYILTMSGESSAIPVASGTQIADVRHIFWLQIP